MRGPYHGRMHLHWCTACNIPVLGGRCGICDGETENVEVSPPGDIRPALEADIRLINRTAKDDFGAEIIPEDKVALLNNTSGHDRFDEVVLDGTVLGVLKYDLMDLRFKFLPRMEGARRLYREGSKKTVEVYESVVPFLMKGASVLLPGVVDFDRNIAEGDEVIVISEGRVVGVGKSRLSGDEAGKREKGMFVKLRQKGEPGDAKVPGGGQDWDTVIAGNEQILASFESEALNFIQKVARETELPKLVSFSGGKDSLATLLLVQKALGEVKAVFLDTGMEFPGTREYIREISRELDFEVAEKDYSRFWEAADYFGPPGRDYRWCCKIAKLGPAARFIHDEFPEGCLNFIGQRRYESEIRARSGRTWRNPWIPKQVGASPIQNWTSLHIWLYLLREKARPNPLYEEGIERLGCWACPSSDMVEFKVLKELHPELWGRWVTYLKSHGLDKEQISHGFTRWRRLPKGQRELAERLGIRVEDREVRAIETDVEEADSGLKVSGVLEDFDYERVSNLARSLGGKSSGGMINISGAEIDTEGRFSFEVEDEDRIKNKLKRIYTLALRAVNCFGCGTCLGQCPNGAIELQGGTAHLRDSCTSCGRCHERCPIVRYTHLDFTLRQA